jgi:LCP family protein required for cell wall assembly
MSKGKKIALWSFSVVVFLVAVAGGMALRLLHQAITPTGQYLGWGETIKRTVQIAADPRASFPDQDKITILCMGIDDNWTDSDIVYTKDARTDTLFLLTLDLQNQKVSMLSIPRDTYAHIAGTPNRYFKINEAYSTGGPLRSIETVAELTGVHADHYLVLNIDATKKMVDALGGVDVNVEHEMHYHDKWGHLSIDLKPGFQHLNGDQAVGFARYRHPDAGRKPSPEDGDERRMYRQHVLLRAMIAKAKTFSNLTQMNNLIDVGMSTIRTDMTRTQLFSLANIYKGVQQNDIRTASLPGDDFRGPNGEWFYRLYPDQMRAYVDWLVRDDPTAIQHLATIVVQNGTPVPGLAEDVVTQLKEDGYTHVMNGGNAPRPKVELAGMTKGKPMLPRTEILDTGVPDQQTPYEIAQQLGLQASVIRRPVQPNKVGWVPPPTITIRLGRDYAAAVKATEKGLTPSADTSASPGQT